MNKFLVLIYNKKIQSLLLSFSIFLVFFIVFYIRKDIISVSVISHDQILKALDWLKGDFFWFGPEVPYQKHYLPGPLMYFLLMPPLILSKDPHINSIVWLIIWISMTLTLAFSFLQKICKENLSLFLFVCLILTSDFLFDEFLYLPWNAIFSLFFHLLILICLYNWVEKEKDIYLPFLGIIMGLGLQIHYSILLHLIALSVFLITSERFYNSLRILIIDRSLKNDLNQKLFRWKYLSGFCIFFLLPQTPYIFSFINTEIYFPKPDLNRILFLIDNFFLNLPENIRNVIFYMDLTFSKGYQYLIVCIILYIYKNKKKEQKPFPQSVINLSLLCVFPVLLGFLFPTSLFFLSLFITITFIRWHDNLWPKSQNVKLLFFYFYLLSLSITWVKQVPLQFFLIIQSLIIVAFIFLFLIDSYNKKHKIHLNILRVFILICIFTSVFYDRIIVKNYKGKTSQLKELMGFIYESTGWNSEEALNRIFVVGFRPNKSFSFSYSLAIEEKNVSKKIETLKYNHVYFIVHRSKFKEFIKKYPYYDIKNYLLSGYNIPKEVKEEIIRGHLTLYNSTSFKTSKYILYAYRIENDSIFPEGFHNVPTLYKEPKQLKEYCDFSDVFNKKENTIYFCYLFHQYKELITMVINFSQNNSNNFINVEIQGLPLNVTSSYGVIPHHLMKNIKIKIHCNKIETINLISSVGLHDEIKTDFHKSFFAPLKIKKPINCSSEGIKKVSLYFEHQRGWGETQKKQYSFPITSPMR